MIYQLSEHFKSNEFASKDGAKMSIEVLLNLKELALNLQVLRDAINKGLPKGEVIPIVIISGYRSVAYNAKLPNAAPKSKHTLGQAADIRVPGWPPSKVKAKIEELIADGRMKQGGMKAYNTFTHYDVRGVKTRW